jgi:ATP-dependent exoDNAse (exonuclease V) beta subunit
MTIHKAKGLEFDTVILPGLGHPPRANEARLLAWLERPRAHGGGDLLLAPIRERSEASDPIYSYLDRLDQLKAKHEDGRLLYVATTRAKSHLHLLGHAEVREGAPRAAPRSLLERLWPVVEAKFVRAANAATADLPADDAPRQAPLRAIRRFPADWSPPAPPRGIAPASAWIESAVTRSDVEFSWASETAKHVGTVVHRALQLIAEEGLAHWSAERAASLRGVFARDLRAPFRRWNSRGRSIA